MPRTYLLFFLFLLFGGLSLWYLTSKPDDRSTVTGADRDFAVQPDRIYKIFIADRQGNQTTLERKGDHWLYNGRWKARPNAMENLLDAIGRVEMKYKPPRAAVPNMIKNLAADGIKVELFDRRGDKIKAYYVGGSTPDERGTYIILEDADEPYVAHIPSWSGNLRFRYNLKGDDWRDKTVFDEKPEDVVAVTVEYPLQQNQSFRLEKTGREYQVAPFQPLAPKSIHPYRKGSAETYLYGFENLIAEAFENDNPRRDSILQLQPFSIITVKRADGSEKTVRFYPIFEKFASDGQVVSSAHAERYFAAIDNGDFMLVQNRLFKVIFWGYEMFFGSGLDT